MVETTAQRQTCSSRMHKTNVRPLHAAVLYPELGTLEQRVTKFYLDELLSNTGPDLEETAYWFHTPQGRHEVNHFCL